MKPVKSFLPRYGKQWNFEVYATHSNTLLCWDCVELVSLFFCGLLIPVRSAN